MLTTGVEVDGATLTVAEDLASAAALFAVTVTAVVVVTVGAVSKPPLEMVPAVVDHTTAVLLVPLTVAANCCVRPEVTVALVGLTLTAILLIAGGLTVTVAVAVDVGDATLFAVTVTDVVAETAGAVNKPVLEMLPAVVDHSTDVFVDPLTAAVNCWVAPAPNVTVLGET